MRIKTILILLIALLGKLNGQLSLIDGSSDYVIDFDESVIGVNSGAYMGTGFSTTPNVGQLDADAWSTTGWNDGAKPFGVSNTTGDHARGTDSGGVAVGGLYGFDIVNGNKGLGIQPTAGDWTPGTITLKIFNNSTSIINDMNLDYTVYVRNDQNYSSSFNLSISSNNTNYTSIPEANLNSPQTSGNTDWIGHNKSIQLSELAIQPCTFFYLRWSSSDVSGSGNRDELALDDIHITTEATMACVEPNSQPTNFNQHLITSNSIQATFSNAPADKYLVIQSEADSLTSQPADGVVYANGTTLGGGTIVQYSNQLAFNSMGLTESTHYYFYIFAANDNCSGGPIYRISNPLVDTLLTQQNTNSNYYAGIGNETCEELKTILFNLIDGHTSVSYASLWTHYQTTDDHLNDSGTEVIVWDMYSDNPNGAENEFTFVTEQCGNYQDEGDCYNREHTFPKSWWGGSTSAPQYTDIFAVVPADGWINGVRNNNPYGEVQSGTETVTTNNGSRLGSSSIAIPGYSGSVFEPTDDYKGDLARGYFYMATRYQDVIASWENSTTESAAVLDGSSFMVYEPWMVDLLINWHNSDPIDQKEIDRNDAIFGIQGNRNPFIDHPEYVSAIWNTCGAIDSCIYVYNTGNSGAGTLRSAIDCAVSGDTIKFSPDIHNTSIVLSLDSILINKNIIMIAEVADSIRITAQLPLTSSHSSIFKIDACATVSLIGFTIDGAFGPNGSAIINEGLLIMKNMTITPGGNTNINSVLQNRIGSTLISNGVNVIQD